MKLETKLKKLDFENNSLKNEVGNGETKSELISNKQIEKKAQIIKK